MHLSYEEELLAVKKIFPNLDERITKRFTGNKDFRQLCRDYFLYTKHIEKLEKEIDEKKASILNCKYEWLRLENELFRYLSETEIDTTTSLGL
jgi:hypothetical protein